MKQLLTGTALALALGLSLVSCDDDPAPARDFVGEHVANMEELIATKAEMAEKLARIKDRASADALAPDIKKLDDDIKRIIDRDNALGRGIGYKEWEKAEAAIDEDMDKRGLKVHEDGLRLIFRLKMADYYNSKALWDVLK